MEDITDYLINREDSIEYKTSDKNVANIETNIKNLLEYIYKDEIYNNYKNGECNSFNDFEVFCINHCRDIENLLEDYTKQKQEKEKWKELYLDKLDETTDIILDYNKLKEKVKIVDKIQELKENIHNILDKNGITRAYQIAIDEQFEKILKESEGK